MLKILLAQSHCVDVHRQNGIFRLSNQASGFVFQIEHHQVNGVFHVEHILATSLVCFQKSHVGNHAVPRLECMDHFVLAVFEVVNIEFSYLLVFVSHPHQPAAVEVKRHCVLIELQFSLAVGFQFGHLQVAHVDRRQHLHMVRVLYFQKRIRLLGLNDSYLIHSAALCS